MKGSLRVQGSCRPVTTTNGFPAAAVCDQELRLCLAAMCSLLARTRWRSPAFLGGMLRRRSEDAEIDMAPSFDPDNPEASFRSTQGGGVRVPKALLPTPAPKGCVIAEGLSAFHQAQLELQSAGAGGCV